MSQNELNAKMFKEMFLAGAKNLEAKKEFWNCIRMTPFSLGISLYLAFKEWKPIMDAERSISVTAA